MTEQFRITQRPQAPQQQLQNPQETVAARPVSYLAALPAPDAELQGLVKGLAHLNPALASWGMERAAEQKKEFQEQAQVRVQTAPDPVAELNKGSPELPPFIPPMAEPTYMHALRAGLAQRVPSFAMDSFSKGFASCLSFSSLQVVNTAWNTPSLRRTVPVELPSSRALAI